MYCESSFSGKQTRLLRTRQTETTSRLGVKTIMAIDEILAGEMPLFSNLTLVLPYCILVESSSARYELMQYTMFVFRMYVLFSIAQLCLLCILDKH